MFSIVMHRVYIAVLVAITLILSYQGLVRVYTHPAEASTYGLCAIATTVLCTLMIRRWFQLEFLWARAQTLLVPNRTKEDYRKAVKHSLNRVLSKKVFRHEMKRVLNKDGVFKIFTENSIPVVQLDIAFPNPWNNHDYFRCALGWIAACMPPTIMCQTLERKDTRLVLRFIHRDIDRKDAQGLHDAIAEWKKMMQSVLVLHLDKCTVQDLNYVPQKISSHRQTAPLPNVPKTAFEEHVLLTEEHVLLHIGYDGSAYYTFFEDGVTTQMHGRREYQSWNALWAVWQHMDEVQDAFKKPVKPRSAAMPASA